MITNVSPFMIARHKHRQAVHWGIQPERWPWDMFLMLMPLHAVHSHEHKHDNVTAASELLVRLSPQGISLHCKGG